jgi:hypothetical protein
MDAYLEYELPNGCFWRWYLNPTFSPQTLFDFIRDKPAVFKELVIDNRMIFQNAYTPRVHSETGVIL